MSVFSLDINHFASRDGKTNIKRPLEVAFFSRDKDLKIHPFSNGSLRYYCPPFFAAPHVPPYTIDLTRGFQHFHRVSETTDEHLDNLLETLEILERRNGQRTNVDFITWRGMMTKIVTSLYDDEDGWEMRATRFQGTIFIEEDHTFKLSRDSAQQNRNKANAPNRSNPFPAGMPEYWGYKFETLALLTKPLPEVSRDEVEGREAAVVSNAEQYCSVVRSGIGNSSLLIAGEVDGVMGYKPDSPEESARWIELKTSRLPGNARGAQVHGKKLFKFWAQSYLIGCPTIILGCRTPDGDLTELREMQTRDLPNEWKRYGSICDANASLRAAASLLDFLKEKIDSDGGVWQISRPPRTPLLHLRRNQGPEDGDGGIVSEKFKAWRQELAQG